MKRKTRGFIRRSIFSLLLLVTVPVQVFAGSDFVNAKDTELFQSEAADLPEIADNQEMEQADMEAVSGDAKKLLQASARLDAERIKNTALAKVGQYYPSGYCVKFVEELYSCSGQAFL